MGRRKSGKFTRKKPAEKEFVDRQRRRSHSVRRFVKAASPSPWFEDWLRHATPPPSSTSCLSSSYFLCHKCSGDAADNEPVVTFCGHVFCWSCLYDAIVPDGIKRLRGACPACECAVDLCPRTKNVCPIYYVKGPQAFPANHVETDGSCEGKGKGKGEIESEIGSKGKSEIEAGKSEIEAEIDSKGKRKIESDIDSKGKSEIEAKIDSKGKDKIESVINSNAECKFLGHSDTTCGSDSDDDGKSEIMKERLKKFIKIDPSKRPSDKRPLIYSSFVTFGIHNGGAIETKLFCHMQILFRQWKCTKTEINDIIEEILSLGEKLSLQLVNQHELGAQAVKDLQRGVPVNTQRENILPSCMGIEEASPSLSPSFDSVSHYFSCNICYGDTTSREPIITYCGHVYCWSCFHDNILGHGFQECLVCRSTVDASTVCPISCGGEAGDSQIHKTRKKWQSAVLVLDPTSVLLQIHSMVSNLDREIVVHTDSFYDTILKLFRCMEEFCSGMRKHTGGCSYIPYRTNKGIHKYISKEDVRPASLMSNIKGVNISSRTTHVVQNEPAMTNTPIFPGPQFFCGSCLTHTLNDPVVTYCTHLFCWPCLYRNMESNGTHDEDGSIHGPCPVCGTDNVVFSGTTAKLTVIPICQGPESISQENQKIEEEDSTKVPPRPTAKRLSIRELKKMRDSVSQTLCKIEGLTNNLESKMVSNENILCSAHQTVRVQRHRLLLGLMDGWRWAYRGDWVQGVVGTNKAETQISSLSKSWLDVVNVDSACILLNKKEVLSNNEILFLTS